MGEDMGGTRVGSVSDLLLSGPGWGSVLPGGSRKAILSCHVLQRIALSDVCEVVMVNFVC